MVEPVVRHFLASLAERYNIFFTNRHAQAVYIISITALDFYSFRKYDSAILEHLYGLRRVNSTEYNGRYKSISQNQIKINCYLVVRCRNNLEYKIFISKYHTGHRPSTFKLYLRVFVNK